MPPRRLSEFLRLKRPAERPPLCGLFGVSGLVVPKDPSLAADVGVPPPYTVVRQDEELPAYLVEIPHRPQAYVASRVERTDEDGALAFALDPRSNRSPLSVVEGPVQADHAEGEANIELYRGEVVRLSVRSRGQGLLVLNDAFAPGWTATVDGAPTPILKVNYLVRGVWVKDGSQEVEFRYRTPLFFPGLALAALALALIALSSLHREKAPARQDPARPSRP